jgi:hypothetical protein
MTSAAAMAVAADTAGASVRRAEWACYVLSAIPGAALAVAASQGRVSEQSAMLGFALSFVALNVAHLAATWTEVYLDPASWRSAPVTRVLVPGMLILLALAVDAGGGWVLLLNLQLYLSIHHAQMQNYGLVRTTQRRSGRALGGRMSRIDQAACLLGPLAVWMWRSREICDHYRGAPLYAPPAWLIAIVGAAGAVALVAYAARELAEWRRGTAIDPVGPAIVIGVNVLWMAVLLTVPHPLFALYAIAAAHYVQYLYFVWRVQTRRPRFGALPAAIRARIAAPAGLGYLVALTAIGIAIVGAGALASAAMRHVAVLLAPAVAPAAVLPTWSVAIIAVNLAHYWLDARIWRTGTAPAAVVHPR